MLIPKDDPKLIRFQKALRSKGLKPNTERLYLWQGKRMLVDFQKKKTRPEDLIRHAELYLRRLRDKGSRGRGGFLQACSAAKILLPAVLPINLKRREIPEDVLRKLQSA